MSREDAATREQTSAVRGNLTGLCRAIIEYGLPLDGETRRYVRGKIDLVAEAAEAGSGSGPAAREALVSLIGSFERCDPVLAAGIKGTLASLEPG